MAGISFQSSSCYLIDAVRTEVQISDRKAQYESRLNAIFYSAWARQAPRCASFLFIRRMLWFSVLFDLELLSLCCGLRGGRWRSLQQVGCNYASFWLDEFPWEGIRSLWSILFDQVTLNCRIQRKFHRRLRIEDFICSFLCIGIVQGDLYCTLVRYWISFISINRTTHYALCTLASSIRMSERSYLLKWDANFFLLNRSMSRFTGDHEWHQTHIPWSRYRSLSALNMLCL